MVFDRAFRVREGPVVRVGLDPNGEDAMIAPHGRIKRRRPAEPQDRGGSGRSVKETMARSN